MKKFLIALVAVVTVFAVLSLTACGGPEKDDSKGTTSIFEVEDTNLDDFQGGGWSGGPSGPAGLVEDVDGSLGASNGWFYAYTWSAGQKFVFEISSTEATTGELVMRLGSDFANMTITNDAFDVVVNGTSINYGTINLPQGGSEGTPSMSKFQDFKVGTINLNQGVNTIELLIKTNTILDDHHNFAPAVDCIKIASTAKLSMAKTEGNY